MPITWKEEFNTGIDEIDTQHKRIVDFINRLEEANQQQDRAVVSKVLHDCVDYTLIHFTFEEYLQEEAGYEFLETHKKIHALFTQHLTEFQRRFNGGEDVATELHEMLSRWLINHIKMDDADYVDIVLRSAS